MVTFMFYAITIFAVVGALTHTITITEKATSKLKTTIKNVVAETEQK